VVDELLELFFIQNSTPLSVATLCPLAFEVRVFELFIALCLVPEFADMWGSIMAYSFASWNINRVNYGELHCSVLV
jgi:hypothetical protein